jgi:hypothetical protein
VRLKIFQSDKGDCLLLEAASGELVLCDGGMTSSMKKYVRDELSRIGEEEGRELEFIYVSHIDNDHISGVLQLLEDVVEWRVYDHHNDNGEETKKPKVPRPPVIKGILHNAFRDQITDNEKPIESLLAARAVENLLTRIAPSLYGTGSPELIMAADEMQSIATGVPEAIQVSKLVAADALDIPVNRPPGVNGPARLLYAGQPGEVFDLGSMRFTLIGPTEDELKDLRDGWNNWLRRSEAALEELNAKLKKRLEGFTSGALSGSPFDLGSWEGIPSYKNVTVPNVASLMYLVEEDGKRLLLTGDAQQDFIIAGLKRTGFLGEGDDDGVHLDVLKVQHHGSEHNMDINFARKVSADHYVFCGDGQYKNPDERVIDIVYNSRLGPQSKRALAPEADDRDFHFWFSTTSAAQGEQTEKRKYFRGLEEKLEGLKAASGGRLHLHFNEDAYVVLDI